MLRERLRPAVVIGGTASLVGLALLTHVFPSGLRPGVYDGVAFLSALMAAYVVVTIRQLHATEHSSTIFAAQCAYGLAICAGPAVLNPTPVTPVVLALLVAVGLSAAFGQLALTRSYRDLPVAEGALLQTLTPLGVAVGSVVFFGEHFSLTELAGAALILAGTAFTSLRR